jgi:RNA polymerase sporulation-specific sigma factor
MAADSGTGAGARGNRRMARRNGVGWSGGVGLLGSDESRLGAAPANLREPDENTIRRAQQGDSEALGFIFDCCKGLVRAKSRTYFLAGADSEDLIQEGMIGLYEAIRDYRADKSPSFRAFADMCVTRQIITAVKAAASKKHVPLNSYVPLNISAPHGNLGQTLEGALREAGALDPEEMLISSESSQGFQSALEKLLSPFEKEVLRRYLSGEAYSEMSEKIGKGTKSIDNALQRAKRKLEKCLGRDRA